MNIIKFTVQVSEYCAYNGISPVEVLYHQEHKVEHFLHVHHYLNVFLGNHKKQCEVVPMGKSFSQLTCGFIEVVHLWVMVAMVVSGSGSEGDHASPHVCHIK